MLGENSQNPKYVLSSIIYDDKSYLFTKGKYLKNIPEHFPQ